MAEKSPLVGAARGVTPIGVPSAGLSVGWMLASRANLRFARRESDNVRAPRRQDQSRVAGQEAWQECSEGMPIFCPKNGVHFIPSLEPPKWPVAYEVWRPKPGARFQ